MLRIKLVRSPIGHTSKNRATIQALGLRKIRQVVEHDDNPSIRGMVHRVQSFLEIEVVEGVPVKAAAKAAAKQTPAKKAPAPPKVKSETPAPRAEKPKAAAKPKAKSKTEEK